MIKVALAAAFAIQNFWVVASSPASFNEHVQKMYQAEKLYPSPDGETIWLVDPNDATVVIDEAPKRSPRAAEPCWFWVDKYGRRGVSVFGGIPDECLPTFVPLQTIDDELPK